MNKTEYKLKDMGDNILTVMERYTEEVCKRTSMSERDISTNKGNIKTICIQEYFINLNIEWAQEIEDASTQAYEKLNKVGVKERNCYSLKLIKEKYKIHYQLE